MKKLFIVGVLIIVLVAFSGCFEEKKPVGPDNIPADQDGKSSEFMFVGLIKCSPNQVIFKVKNTGETTIYFPYIFVGENKCNTLAVFESPEEWRYDESLYQAYKDKEYYVVCPDTDEPESIKHEFVDGAMYFIRIEAMRNTGSLICDYSVDLTGELD